MKDTTHYINRYKLYIIYFIIIIRYEETYCLMRAKSNYNKYNN